MKRLVRVETIMVLDEDDYDSWLSERVEQWSSDNKEQVSKLIDNGEATFRDGIGTTVIMVEEFPDGK